MINKKNSSQNNNLVRYTCISNLIVMLKNKKILLSDPKNWEDKNERSQICKYKEINEYKYCKALCFFKGDDKEYGSYHLWKCYAGHHNGVKIVFSKSFEEKINDHVREFNEIDQELFFHDMEYIKYSNLNTINKDYFKLIAYKRSAYEHEKEKRLYYFSKDKPVEDYYVKLDDNSIDSIQFSPWLNEDSYEVLRNFFRSSILLSFSNINISKITNSNKWIENIKKINNLPIQKSN